MEKAVTTVLKTAFGLFIGIILMKLNLAFTDNVLQMGMMDQAFCNLHDSEAAPRVWDIIFWVVFLSGAPIGGVMAGLSDDEWLGVFFGACGGLVISVFTGIIAVVIGLVMISDFWVVLVFILYACLIGGGVLGFIVIL